MVSLQAAGQTRHIVARLVVIAEGGANLALSNVKTRDYRQSAVICNVQVAPHLNRAYERFTPEGPLALLPNGNELSLIWTAEHGHAQELATLDDAGFCARLRSTFGAALGGVQCSLFAGSISTHIKICGATGRLTQRADRQRGTNFAPGNRCRDSISVCATHGNWRKRSHRKAIAIRATQRC